MLVCGMSVNGGCLESVVHERYRYEVKACRSEAHVDPSSRGL